MRYSLTRVSLLLLVTMLFVYRAAAAKMALDKVAQDTSLYQQKLAELDFRL